jgi:hypothetical protein
LNRFKNSSTGIPFFCMLQRLHDAAKFSKESSPPEMRGTIWSTSKESKEMGFPQYAHNPPQPSKTLRLTHRLLCLIGMGIGASGLGFSMFANLVAFSHET